MASIDTNRGAKRAREAREALGLDPLEPLTCLLTVVEERLGLPVVVACLPEEIAGACFRDGDAALLWVNGVQGRPRQRFTLAHEVGHAWCRHEGGLEVDSIQTLSGKTTNPLEIQANAFAAEFLLPKVAACEVIDGEPCLDQVAILAAAYGVSAIVALIRLESAGLVGDERAARLRHEIAENEHLRALERLGIEPIDDRLERIATALPYTSPALAGSALAAALRGDVPVEAAAYAAGVATAALAPALRSISAPARVA